jgi:hypothetical protein
MDTVVKKRQRMIVSFGSPGYEKYQLQLDQCCKRYDLRHLMYNSNWLQQTREYKEHEDIFSAKRGYGYWAWKPLVILDALDRSDTVVYCDSGIIFDSDPVRVIDNVREIGVYTDDITPGYPRNPPAYINHTWVKTDCYVYMECDGPKYWEGIHIWAGVVVVKKSGEKFIREWLRFCLDKRIISDDPNTCGFPNLSEFKDHRHDQAILSLLCLKYPEKVQYLEPCFQDCP